jgi:hypothetical protein
MAIGAGAKIRQSIVPDLSLKGLHGEASPRWDFSNARLLNVQILNSVAFEAVTCMMPPPTPISALTYAKAGLPFFAHYDETLLAHLTAGDPQADGALTPLATMVKSVGEVDEQLAAVGLIKVAAYIDPRSLTTGCVACNKIKELPITSPLLLTPLRRGINLSDCILRPCNHTLCSTCHRACMQAALKRQQESARSGEHGLSVHCPLCDRRVENVVGFSSPMGMPGSGQEGYLGFLLRDVAVTTIDSHH